MIAQLEETAMTRYGATVSMLANIERRLVDTAGFIRTDASRLSDRGLSEMPQDGVPLWTRHDVQIPHGTAAPTPGA